MSNPRTLSSILTFQPKQQKAMDALLKKDTKYLLYGGAMAGGKSFFLRWSAILYLVYLYQHYRKRGIEVGLFSEDYPTLKDRQISKLQREVPEWVGKLKDDAIHGLCFRLTKELGYGLILLRNLDDPSKYMSSEFAGIFVDELTRNEEQTFSDLRNRLRYPGISQVKFVGATNPGGIGHGWVKRFFVDKSTTDPEQERFFYIHANAHDNKFISQTYLKQLEALPIDKRKAYLEGSWDIFAGQFFPEFSRQKHIIAPIVPHPRYKRFGSLDWGYSAPHAYYRHILKHEKSDDGIAFNRVITFGEQYGTGLTPEELGKIIEKTGTDDFMSIRTDPAAFHKLQDGSMSIADKIGQSMTQRHLLKPANNDRIGGWALMHNWLSIAPDGLPYWLITENCTNLIRTLPQLIHDENNIEDCDSSGEDHSGDSCRYGLVHIKWIDANVGGVGKTRDGEPDKTANVVDGKESPINLDIMANAWEKQQKRVHYI